MPSISPEATERLKKERLAREGKAEVQPVEPAQETTEGKPLVILGAGMAGSTILLHTLLRAIDDPTVTAAQPLDIKLVERYPKQLYGGIAYGKTPEFDHRLNLAAWRVTPFAGGNPPDGLPTFEEFIDQTLTKQGRDELVEDYLTDPPRRMYGDYLAHLVDQALERAGGKVKFETVIGEVTDFKETSGQVAIDFADGRKLEAGHLVVTTGFKDAYANNLRSVFNVRSNPAFLDYTYSDAANNYYARAARESTKDSEALVMGTGLTGMDTAHRLIEAGYKGKITMVSRRGMIHPLYLEQPDSEVQESTFLKGEPRAEKEAKLRAIRPAFMKGLEEKPFATFEKQVLTAFNKLKSEGYRNEEILSVWEQYVPAVYQRYPEEARDFFLANETLLNVMRVGTVPMVAQRLTQAQQEGQLQILAAEVKGVMPALDGKGLDGSIVLTDPAGLMELKHFDHVISGIGNAITYNLPASEIKDPLWKNLRTRDAYRAHDIYAGLDVTNDFFLKNGDGTPYNHVTAVGALISGHMSTTAYPYPEKPGSGGRLGPFTLNVQGITGAVEAFTDANYDTLKSQMGVGNNTGTPTTRRQSIPRPG